MHEKDLEDIFNTSTYESLASAYTVQHLITRTEVWQIFGLQEPIPSPLLHIYSQRPHTTAADIKHMYKTRSQVNDEDDSRITEHAVTPSSFQCQCNRKPIAAPLSAQEHDPKHVEHQEREVYAVLYIQTCCIYFLMLSTANEDNA